MAFLSWAEVPRGLRYGLLLWASTALALVVAVRVGAVGLAVAVGSVLNYLVSARK